MTSSKLHIFLEFRTMWRPEMVFWDTFIRVFGLWPFFILIKNLTFTQEDTHTGTKMMWNWFKLWNSKEKYFFRIAKQFSKLNKQTFRFSNFCAEKQNNRVSFKLDISIYGYYRIKKIPIPTTTLCYNAKKVQTRNLLFSLLGMLSSLSFFF